MAAQHAPHTHADDKPTEPFDWFKVLDIAVWVSVGLITVMAIELLFGRKIREFLAGGQLVRQASQFLAQQAPAGRPAEA